jgi:hypothetical protein
MTADTLTKATFGHEQDSCILFRPAAILSSRADKSQHTSDFITKSDNIVVALIICHFSIHLLRN